jgi:hypothetical protein
MHRALQVADILDAIFHSFSPPMIQFQGPEGSVITGVRPRDLVNTALVCREWSEPALRILWDNDSFNLFGTIWVQWRDVINLSFHVSENNDASDVSIPSITSTVRYHTHDR